MAITSSELNYFYNAAVVNATSSNGGRIDLGNRISSGVAEALFGHSLENERISGSVVYRKLFPLVANDADLSLLAAGLWLDSPTPAEDWLYLFAGTQRDTQGGISGPRKFGSAVLKSDVDAGVSIVVVTVEDAGLVGLFANADMVKITSNTGVLTAANTEIKTVSGVPGVSELDITLTLSGGLDNAYTVADGARVCSVYQPGTIATGIDNVSATGLSYTADSLAGDNLGTIEQTWTLTGSDSAAFGVVGDTVGALAGGTISAEFAPLNPINSKPYFALPAGAITAMAAGNTLVFQTHPAAPPVWLVRETPAGCSSFVDVNKVKLRFFGESGS
jgi:hypothetical protein